MTPKARMQAMIGDKMLVFGHRGAMAYAPMNTIPAFELAYEQGADGIELDVHRTKDNKLVVIHNFTVDETSNGSGTVTEMSLPQLKELDVGSWFNDNFSGVQIPTLQEVFETVGKKLFINVEIKSIPPQDDGIEILVAEAIQHHGLEDRVFVSSFNPFALKRFRTLSPTVPLGFLYETTDLEAITQMMAGIPHEAHHPYYANIDEPYMQWAKDKGYFINTWTVNDVAKACELRDLGVNAIITNIPDKIIDVLKG